MSSLEGPREALAASLVHINATVRAYLAPHHEIAVKRAVDAALRASAEYAKAFHEAELECQGRVVVPRYLTEDMFQALKAHDDPVHAWKALVAVVEAQNEAAA